MDRGSKRVSGAGLEELAVRVWKNPRAWTVGEFWALETLGLAGASPTSLTAGVLSVTSTVKVTVRRRDQAYAVSLWGEGGYR